MQRIAVFAIGLLVPLAVLAAPSNAQAKRNYDCTKPGNATKVACKGAVTTAAKPAPAPAPKPVAAAKPAPPARNYDCTKPGNANKAACKGSTSLPNSVPVPAKPAAPATMPKSRNYDCSKPGNANKAACKGAVAAQKPVFVPAPAKPAPAPTLRQAPAVRPAPVSRPSAAPAARDAGTNPRGPDGATAQCKDGTYSKSTHRTGTCAGHKGVATWY